MSRASISRASIRRDSINRAATNRVATNRAGTNRVARRARACVVAVLVLSLVSACVGSPPGPSPSTNAAAHLTRTDLQASGITIVNAESEVTGPVTSLTLTGLQADRLIAEANAGAGLSGRDIDALAPVATGLPPASYLVASYVNDSGLVGASVAKSLIEPGADFTHAQGIVFPTAVIALLVSDLMTAAAAADSFTPTPSGLGMGTSSGIKGAAYLPGRVVQSSMLQNSMLQNSMLQAPTGPCSTVTNFLSSSIQGLFDVLRVIPGVIGAIDALGPFGKVLSALINGAIGLAQGVVEGVVSVVTQPVLDAMRFALSGLGIASLVLSYFTNEKLLIKPQPSDHLPFSVDPGATVRGTFIASALSLTTDWPAALVDCANVSGAKIPELMKAGDTATWAQSSGADLITPDSLTSTVGSDKTTTMTFSTGHEDAETAKGPELTTASRVTVSIPRKEVGDFLDLATNEIGLVKSNLLAKIPSPLRGLASTALGTIIDPIVASVKSSISGSVGGILTLKGDGMIWVIHHAPKEPTPTPGPTPATAPTPSDDGSGAFCEQFNAQVTIAAAALPGLSDAFGWARDFGAGLQSITAKPPASMSSDFTIIVGFYTLVGTLTIQNTQPVADYVAANDIDGARVRVWQTCKSPQLDLSL
ncbi:hypothetical protein [Subtercola frigoramans]|uniref:PASTA domain-containing protein n=1 Tax=Subtercola frigoramans TaxID=120298 RepID=A0ABS2L377_9MICO|nr:hypothetical protein [Subtercola frigoramans]MBM7471548.1 hypothetical protein [Subtercola frigoramans]